MKCNAADGLFTKSSNNTCQEEDMMIKFKQGKIISLSLVILSLVTTIPLLTNAQIVRANEAEVINPHSGFDYFLLLEDQSVTSSTTQTSSLDAYSVGVISIGNNILSARLSISETEATGIWWLSIMGTGGIFWFDLTYGIVPVSGSTATIDIYEVLSFGLATGGIILTSPVSAEDPVEYNITVTGSMAGGS